MISRRALDHELALIIAVARARNTGRRQRVARCRAAVNDGRLCPCDRWVISEVHTAPPEDAIDLRHINPVAVPS